MGSAREQCDRHESPHMHRLLHNGVPAATTPLRQAAGSGSLEACRLLISRNADVNLGDLCNEATPLHIAAQGAHTPVTYLLIESGANVDARSKKRQTPLQGQKEAAICLLDHGADISSADVDGNTPLHFAAQGGHLKVLKRLSQQQFAHPPSTCRDVWTQRGC